MTWIEIIATAFGLLCVWLTVRRNIWCWPAGLVQVALFIWIFYHARLYSDAGLHVIYVGLCVYGWWYWLRGGEGGSSAPLARLPRVHLAAWVGVVLSGTGALGWTVASYTDASLPYWDASTTVGSLVAQYLMARKRLESWLFWITVDILAIGVYIAKELYVTAGLYAVFLALAITGWFAWKRSIGETSPLPTAA